jgi:hypothetical protein
MNTKDRFIFILVVIFILSSGAALLLLGDVKNITKEYDKILLEYNKELLIKDSLILHYDSVYKSHELEKLRVLESFNKIINENDKTIQSTFKRYYSSHDTISWNELDSLLSVLIK